MRPHLKEGHTSIRRKRWCMFLQEWDQEAQSPPNSRCWFWFHTLWSPLPPVSHAPPSLCLGAATGHHVSVGAAVGDGADVRKQGPTHTAGVSVSPRSKHHYANDFPAHPTPPPFSLTYSLFTLKFTYTQGQLSICILFTLKCPDAIWRQDSPFRRAISTIK